MQVTEQMVPSMEERLWKALLNKYKKESDSKIQFNCCVRAQFVRFFVQWDSGDVYISTYFWNQHLWLPELYIGNIWNGYLTLPLYNISPLEVTCDRSPFALPSYSSVICDEKTPYDLCLKCMSDTKKAINSFRTQKRFRIPLSIHPVYNQEKCKKTKKV